MEDKRDWRLTNQEKFLKNKKLIFARYTVPYIRWDHDHCEFCYKKFSNNDYDLHEGYCTLDHYHWICENCYNDFKDMFLWKVVDD
jgi:hypothetical protein